MAQYLSPLSAARAAVTVGANFRWRERFPAYFGRVPGQCGLTYRVS